jgi:hypothetical protein
MYAAAEAGVANNATHVLTFEAALPPVRPSEAGAAVNTTWVRSERHWSW